MVRRYSGARIGRGKLNSNFLGLVISIFRIFRNFLLIGGRFNQGYLKIKLFVIMRYFFPILYVKRCLRSIKRGFLGGLVRVGLSCIICSILLVSFGYFFGFIQIFNIVILGFIFVIGIRCLRTNKFL